MHYCVCVCVCEYFGRHKSLSWTNSAKRQCTCEQYIDKAMMKESLFELLAFV